MLCPQNKELAVRRQCDHMHLTLDKNCASNKIYRERISTNRCFQLQITTQSENGIINYSTICKLLVFYFKILPEKIYVLYPGKFCYTI